MASHSRVEVVVTADTSAAPHKAGEGCPYVIFDAADPDGECRTLAHAASASLLPPLAWQDVPRFLAGAAVTIVPSVRETFGNLALESQSAGTPVVAHATGNLPILLGSGGGVLVPQDAGPAGL